MTHELFQYTAEQIIAAEKNRLIIKIAVDAIITLSTKGIIETLNPATEYLFGYSYDEIIGKHINMLIPEISAEKSDAQLNNYAETGLDNDMGVARQVVGKHQLGREIKLSLSVGKIEVDNNISFVGIIRDLSLENTVINSLPSANEDWEKKSQLLEQQKMEIQAKSDEILKASRYKSEFLANMSHELRSPLNSMLILAKMLSDNENGNFSHDEVESANVIYSSGKDLLKLINDILDVSKVEAGKLHIDKRVFSIRNLIENISRQFKKIAQSKNIEFSVTIDSDIPGQMNTDDHRLMQILKNLISNAFKFTKKGSVHLSVVLENTDNSPGVIFHIKDTGVGIPEHKQEEIFEAFQQAEGTTSRKYGGTGLGLSISNALAQLLGGEIKVSSQPEQGSIFSLILPENTWRLNEGKMSETDIWQTQDMVAPLSDVEDLASSFTVEQDLEISEDDEILSNKRVLLVDDDLRNTFSLSRALSNKGCNVSIADNGELALEKMANNTFDIVLMDMIMPVLDGYQTVQKIRQQLIWQDIPIIALTAKAMAEDQQKCLEAGASDYLAKPIEIDKLLGLMKKWLNP